MKIGRNAPCPCGSGRKYKHCCYNNSHTVGHVRQTAADDSFRSPTESLDPQQVRQIMLSQMGFEDAAEMDAALAEYQQYCESQPRGAPIRTFMEFRGQPNAATRRQRAVTEALSGRQFSNAQQAQQFVEQFTADENNAARADFEGLSSARMHQILSGGIEDNRTLVRLVGKLPERDALSSEVVIVAQFILRQHAEKGGELDLTANGNYQRRLCRAYHERFIAPLGVADPVPNERSLPMLATVHHLLLELEYTDETRNRSWLTTNGVELYAGDAWESFYRNAFRYLTDRYDWQAWLDERLQQPHLALIQHSALFLLYLLHRNPVGTVGELYRRYEKAFPAFSAAAGGNAAARTLLRDAFQTMFLYRYCALFGLLTYGQPVTPGAIDDSTRYSVSLLFRSLLQWQTQE